MLLRDLADATGVCSHHRIGDQNIRGACVADRQKLERSRTFEISDAVFGEAPHRECELRGLDVWTPPVWVTAEQLDRCLNVFVDELRIECQRRSHHSIYSVD